jgi:hypothetical protein
MTSVAARGMQVVRTRFRVLARSASRLPARISTATKIRNAKTDMAGSVIGTPPHRAERNTEEYGLSIVTWQPEVPVASSPASPGRNEQCTPWTCRS